MGGRDARAPSGVGEDAALHHRAGLLAPLRAERKPANAAAAAKFVPIDDGPCAVRVVSVAVARWHTRRESMRIALFEPDIPQNTGTILRLAACLGLEVDIIEPAGFPVSDRAFRRAGMDYLDLVALRRHPSWPEFERWRAAHSLRLLLFTTKAATSYLDHRYEARDILLFGRESAGVPDRVHDAADVRLRIPMRPRMRSINVAMACAMAVGEALRQTVGSS